MDKSGTKWSVMENSYSFKGTYAFRIDKKGRIIIPSKLRKQITTNQFTIIASSANSLVLYPDDSFKAFEKKIMETLNEKQITIIKNYIYSSAEDLQLDSQGRLKIPGTLLQKANIEEDILIVGAMDRIELWKPEQFRKRTLSIEKEHKETLEEIGL